MLLIALLLVGCKDDDCGNMDCFTPPTTFVFELVDKTTGENLFTNGTLDSEDISIINTLDIDEVVEFGFIGENNYNLITINSIGWTTEQVNMEVSVGDETFFSLYVDAERKSECCSYTEYNEVLITGADYSYNQTTGIYTIFVE